jgi:hypothetical protein
MYGLFGLSAGGERRQSCHRQQHKDMPEDILEHALRELNRFEPKKGNRRSSEVLHKVKEIAGKIILPAKEALPA